MIGQTMKLEEEKTKDNNEKWKLFNITNYESLMRHCIWLNVHAGFLRYKIESSRYVSPKSSFSFRTILMVLVIIICLVWSTYLINFSNKIKDPSMVIHFDFIVILSPIIVFWGISSNNSTVKVIQKVADVSRLLPPRTFRKLAKMIYIKEMFQLIPYIIYLPIAITPFNPVIGFTSWYTFFMMIVANALYINNIYVLKACFEKINDSLEKMSEVLTKDEPYLLRRLYQSQKNPMLLSELRALKKQHLEISRVTELINETYGIQNIGMIFLLFIDTTFNVYHHTVLFIQVASSIWFSSFNHYIFYHCMNIIVIAWTVETTRDQAQKIGSNIHRIAVNTFDEQMTTELQLFSLQALQCVNRFTALGLPIDATILTKLICSITTNVLILIQFLFIKTC